MLTRNDCRINGMALNPLEPNYIFVCGDSPFLDLYDARKAESPAARCVYRQTVHVIQCMLKPTRIGAIQ